jgi:hypothetical protein
MALVKQHSPIHSGGPWEKIDDLGTDKKITGQRLDDRD